MTVYISGKITGTNDYEIRFYKAEKYLKGMGYQVVNPVTVGKRLCRRLKREATWEEYLEKDLKALKRCDVIALLSGWEESKGACFELDLARKLGLRIIEVII